MNKKIISLLIIFCISLSSVCVFSSPLSQNFTADETAYMAEALTALGAYSNITAVTPESVSRGDVISACIHLIGMDNISADVSFSDLKPEHPQYKEICTAYSLGIVRGDESGTIRPDDKVTYLEATVIILRTLGYGPLMDGGMTYGDALSRSKITRGVSDSASIGEQIITMLYNALSSPMNVLSGIGDDFTYTASENETILSVYRGIYYGEGVVSGNSKTFIDKSGHMPDGKIAIEQNVYGEGDTNASELLGRMTEFWYKKDSGKRSLIYIIATDDVTVIKADDILSYDDKAITYCTNDSDIEKITLSTNVNVIKNGVAAMPFDSSDILIERGSLTLIDNDKNGKADIVLSQVYDIFVVQSVNVDEEVLYGKFGAAPIDLSDAEHISLEARNGDIVELAELTEWDVLCVYADGGGKYYDIIYSPDERTGRITGTAENGTVVTIEGKSYKISDYYFQNVNKPIHMNEFGVYFLDINDEIVAINDEYVLGDLRYGYAVAYKLESNISGNTVYVKVFEENAKMNVYTIAKAVTIDGVSYRGFEQIQSYFSDASYRQPQLILFGLNGSGQIDKVDTIRNNAASSDIYLNRFYTGYTYDENDNPTTNSTLTYRNTTKIFQGKVSINSNTKVFLVPLDAETAPEDSFSIRDHNYFQNDQSYYFEAYRGFGASHDADVLLIYTSAAGAASGLTDEAEEVSVIDEVSMAIDSNGMDSYKIKYWREGKYREDFVYEPDVIDGVMIEGSPWIPHKGDIAQFEINSYNQITFCKPIYLAHKNKLLTSNPSATHVHNSPRFQLAYVYSKYGNNILVTRTRPEVGVEYNYTMNDLESKAADLYNIYVYDSKKDTIRTGTTADLHAHIQTSLQKATKVFIDDRYGKPRTMLVVE